MSDPAVQLSEIADLLVYLPLMATTRNPLDGEPQHRPPASTPPMNLDPIVLADELHATLVSWIMLAHDDQLADDDDWPADNTLACCLWLQRHSPALCDHPAGGEWRTEVKYWWRRIRRAVGERAPRVMRHWCARCGAPAALINDGELWACPECGREDDGPRRQIDTFRHAPSEPTEAICQRFGVTPQWVYDQRRRRKLQPDTSKGDRPKHWWPWDVFALLNPGIVDLWERRVESGQGERMC